MQATNNVYINCTNGNILKTKKTYTHIKFISHFKTYLYVFIISISEFRILNKKWEKLRI